MHKDFLVLAHLACLGHGKIVVSSVAENQNLVVDSHLGFHAYADLKKLSKGVEHLTKLLLAFNPVAAFSLPIGNPTPVGEHSAALESQPQPQLGNGVPVVSGSVKLTSPVPIFQRVPIARMGTAAPVADPEVKELQHIEVDLPSVLDDKAWGKAFRGLLAHDTFLSHAWARHPVKLPQEWRFAVGSYTIDQVLKDSTLLPPQFCASGVQVNGVSFMKGMHPGFTSEAVHEKLQSSTVVMLHGGFVVPTLAHVSLALLEATALPIWTNVYVTRPGLSSSTQLHTDKQDVLVVQSSGRKRWRVYSPPPPAKTPQRDPFCRGKGDDPIVPIAEDLLIDTVLEPGHVLYVPAAFPHETDTLDADVEGGFEYTGPSAPATEDSISQAAVHLTLGVDTHLWGLTWANMREKALIRAKLPPTLASGLPITSLPPDRCFLLHSPLPFGFAASQLHTGSTTAEALAGELASRLARAEPERWADAETVAAQLPLRETAERMLVHYERVLELQRGMYKRAVEGVKGVQEKMFEDMDALDEATQSFADWAARKEKVKPVKKGFSGMKAATPGKGKTKSKGKAKKKKR